MSVDTVAIVWYAAVCGALSGFAPSFGGRALRLGIGAVVGIVAATVLPLVKSMIGL